MRTASGVLACTCVLVTALVLAGCEGSGDDPASAPATTPAEPATESAAPSESAPSGPAPSPPPEPDPAPSESPTEPPPPEPEPPAEPSPPPLPEGLPEDITGYEDWVKLNSEPIPPIETGDAHLGTKDVFASQEADRLVEGLSYPDGTILVKQAIRPDRDFIGLIAIMRKIPGFDPANNDWEFVEYARSEPEDAFSILASGNVCSSCHMGAAATDYVWVHTTGDAP